MSDTSHSLLTWILIGGASGCFAGVVWRGRPYQIIRDIVLGVMGACVVSGIAHVLDLSVANSVFLDIVTSTAGALVALAAMRQLRKT
ncbi:MULTISPECIES: GlsB/YeaQ/YmgE family stress response membrane protein [Burkholderia]|uniref:GlsB/YeaQ/YmgE family stress response membrane protein n=1 Tax=Burkholderia cenocepacia TaxID=95486 RepID=A0A071MRS6_9BURK|nr:MULTISPECIES: GlsB/YeaQ/YmgE family stress response membrane protein [Burkholderia]AKM03697.1 hypothetical protein ABD05_26790 [Burkholderia pyrrocinia]AOJ28873.1 hypothetical protein WJ12_29040 [Burkholderia seminalis]MBJ9595224.1 GlsB/YeaQ/YmgE family stress response membrane protein [Burkholderia seminalis]MBN3737667.1 GlsB/YeaQ/YmgE family stress response membrane protein [Burkholderia sp. Tr-20355]MCA8042595.1 GlsB/YeaQ/YmgE family stress response membrane protein [Burkholderia seminal